MYNDSIFLRRKNMNSIPDLFDTHDSKKHNFCEYCGTPLSKNSEDTVCEVCRDRLLFQEVRDFIRENDVNEFQVANQFNIPLRTVKNWIKEGRIEYKEMPNGERAIISRIGCERCGAPITFGVLCPKCLRLLNKNVHGYTPQAKNDDDRMFFLNDSKNKK